MRHGSPSATLTMRSAILPASICIAVDRNGAGGSGAWRE
jgi:hypothetical protein